VDADLDTLATALYVHVDDTLKDHPELWPWRPRVGIAPRLSDAELLTLAVLQVLLGFDEEARWLRYAGEHLRHLFPYLPGQAGYNRRLRKSATQLQALIRALAQDTDLWADDVRLIDSTPVECGRSRPTARRSELAGWAGYGYCASHSRYFWGLRLHLVKPSSPTRATPRPSSRPAWPTTASNLFARPAVTNGPGAALPSSSRYARSSSPSTPLSRPSSASNVTAPTADKASWSECSNDSSL
jgi:hypothetical protein